MVEKRAKEEPLRKAVIQEHYNSQQAVQSIICDQEKSCIHVYIERFQNPTMPVCPPIVVPILLAEPPCRMWTRRRSEAPALFMCNVKTTVKKT